MGISSFLKQLAVRTSAIFLVKLLGFFARIPIFRVLGPEGMGMYQMAYSVYGLILTLLVGGFPTALAITTSKSTQLGWGLFQRLSLILLLVSSITASITFYLAEAIAYYLGDPELAFAIQCLAPAILVAPLLSLFRGFLQGIEKFGMIAFSEIIEQIVRITVMLLFALIWIHHSIAVVVGGVSLGAFAGSLMAFLFLFMLYVKEQKNAVKRSTFMSFHFKMPDANNLLFLNTSLAIAGTRILLPVSDFLDALIVPNRLQHTGMSPSAAISLYGEVAGMAVIVAYIPTILTGALTHTMTAKITMDWQKQRLNRFYLRCKNALAVAWFWGIGSGLLLFFYAEEVSLFMFGTANISTAIRLMAMAPLLGGLRDVSTSILWVTERKKQPLIGLILGIIVSVLVNYYLITVPGMSYVAIVLGVLSIDFIATVYNLIILSFNKRQTSWVALVYLMVETVIYSVMLYMSFNFIKNIEFLKNFAAINNLVSILISYSIIALYLCIRFSKSYFKLG